MRIAMLAGALALAGLMSPALMLGADSLVVTTTQGKVQGKTLNDGKVHAYLGLPYAAPPVGDLRWRAPQPAAKWQGVRDGAKFGAHCAQVHVFDDMIFPDGKESEDCLYLNVYTPAGATAKSKLPVMFWIHGGGYSGGAASEPRHNGDFLPTKNVVLVTINYRLGIFGFLTSPELSKENNGHSGNYGLLDMIAGLQWVHDNITAFGGDAKNVTIFGESAGSFAVSTLMASPKAQPLFAKAIGESGGDFREDASVEKLAHHEEIDGKWLESIGIHTTAEMRALSTDKVLDAASKNKGSMMFFAPVADGDVLPDTVPAIYAAGRQAHVPLLAGWNKDEGAFLGHGMTVEKWKAMAAGFYPDPARAADFLNVYQGKSDAEAARAADDLGGDMFIAFSTWQWIEAHRKTGNAPVYRYRFELDATPSKFHPYTQTFHSDDIEYVFGTLDTRPGFNVSETDRKMSDLMMNYWTNFARTGDPNGPGLPVWPKYGAQFDVMHLDAHSAARPDEHRDRYLFLEKGMPVMPRMF